MRLSWDAFFVSLAIFVAMSRSTCIRRQTACVLVRDRRILSVGYNGSPEGEPNCIEVGCLRSNSPPGKDYDRCRAYGLHDVSNAIINAARVGVSIKGATAYATHSPCRLCAAMLVNAGIKRFVYATPYEGYPEGPEWLAKKGIEVSQLDPVEVTEDLLRSSLGKINLYLDRDL